jgi:hypothetical protein
MRKVINGYLDPITDVISEEGTHRNMDTITVESKKVLDYEVPVRVTIEIEERYLSQDLMERLYKEGWETK